MFNHKLPTDFPMQTLRKKTSPCKYKNEPGRFLGEGVAFRAKLIGVLEVPEARGDRMCQEALADLKMAIRAAGEHKQRIQVHVAIDGLRLRDDKTGDSLYHHPVHKISFIAQDMTDSRAFGYIYGSPDTGHRFFGIKTDKAASQVVIAMRDLFQVVFELKKKEIEMAKQQLEDKTQTSSLLKQMSLSENKSKNSSTGESLAKPVEGAEGGVAELVDLEQELCSLRRGLSQVEGLTPSSDPFGDSFISPPPKGLLPPPPGAGRGRITPGRSSASPSKPPLSFDVPAGHSPSLGTAGPSMGTPGPSVGLPGPVHSLGGQAGSFGSEFEPKPSLVDNVPEPSVGSCAGSRPASYDVFTELDPLGTGRSKPYVDKKLFFQELKNPPKKVLKDLVPTTSILNELLPVTEPKDTYGPPTTMTSLSRHSGGSVSIVKNNQSTGYTGFFSSDPFAETDPFDNTDPFSDTFKEDPFTSMQEFPKSSFLRAEDLKSKISKEPLDKEIALENGKNVFNGPLQVSLPPEPVPKSPRLQRQMTDTSTIRQRPQPSSKVPDNASPPPPLPPKKVLEPGLPPPRPPHEYEPDVEDMETGPPLPKPVRKKEPVADRSMKPRMSSLTTNSSEDEYLAPAPPPLPAAKRFDITLSQLLTLTMDELAVRLRVPATTLSSMTLPQLTEYLRSYLAADVERAHIHVEPSQTKDKEKLTSIPPSTIIPEKSSNLTSIVTEFKPQFEDNFAPTDNADTFVANFEDFDKKANPTYDRYAAFREIQEQELKVKSILDPIEPATKEDDKELAHIQELLKTEEKDTKELEKSPLKSLDELTLDSFNMFRKSVSPKPVDAKIEDIKNVMMNLQLEKARRSVSPREEKQDETDKYAALREITITEPHDDYESIPPEAPKERKKSDEKSDGFDNSDFFDCIDNSSLSFTHVEDAFRKSPAVKEREEEKKIEKSETPIDILPVSLQPPQRLSAGSISDVASGSSPDTKERCVESGGLRRLAWTEGWSSDSRDSEPRRRRRTHRGHTVQTSSSSRDASPWEEERSIRHTTRRDRESRHNSSGSRECLDSGSGREKEKIRDKRESRDQRDSGSGRGRRDLSREKRDKRSRDRDNWDRERPFRERDYRDSRSRERSKDYREMERHRKTRHSYDDEDYSDGCGSGRSSPRDRWPEQRRRRDDRHYGSLGWRETRRRNELRQAEDPGERRYGSTLGWPGRRSGSRRESDRDLRDLGREHTGRDSREHRDSGRDSGRDSRDPRDSGRDSGRDSRDPRDSGRDSGTSNRDSLRDSRDPRRRRREEARVRPNYRFSNDFSPREKEHSPFENDYQESPAVIKKRAPYSSLEGTRFAFEEDTTASPVSGSSARARDGDSPATRFRFDSDSISPRSMFEDDFTLPHVPHIRPRTASIAEEEEGDIPPLRTKPPPHKDIKKSDSVNIFTREVDPFENDAFFACTGSDKVAKRENWPGDFVGFENI